MLIPHLLLADFGWYFRYEMYLIGMGLLFLFAVLGSMVLDGLQTQIYPIRALRIAIAGLVLWFCLSSLTPRFKTLYSVVQATHNIYQQQYQMARFLYSYYQDVPVAVNDIGWVAYYSQVELIDLWGLADLQVAQHWLSKRYTTARIQSYTTQRGVQVAMVYDAWFQNGMRLPASWKRAGQWTIQNNVVCGDDTVSIYAVDPAAFNALAANLHQFSEQLPDDVIQAGSYLYYQPAVP
jgi:hypothetical protein